MKSAITVCLVAEMAGGPFVFWHDLPGACEKAAELGFDAIELFPPQAWGFDVQLLSGTLKKHNLRVAAMGSGPGWVKHRLLLTSPNPGTRENARNFIAAMIDCAAEHHAPVIIGSMQGKVEAGSTRDETLALLRESIEELAPLAARKGQVLLIEPLNRYETNLLGNIQQGLEFISSLRAENVRLLLDLFHMNIEEQDMAAVIRLAGPAVGHVHLADSNRRAAGFGHTDFRPIFQALRDIRYDGYVSGEILPWPTSEAAAAQTIAAIKEFAR